jgi:putative drug exporter of the RND superfamily
MRAPANWCSRHWRSVMGGWVGLVIVLGGVLGAAGGARFTDSTRLPASDSSTAYGLLAKAGNDSASAKVGTIVWHIDHGSAVSGAARSRMAAVLGRVSRVDGVQSVISPFTAAGDSQISNDGRTAYATVIFDSTSHTDEAKDIADAAATPSLQVPVRRDTQASRQLGSHRRPRRGDARDRPKLKRAAVAAVGAGRRTTDREFLGTE